MKLKKKILTAVAGAAIAATALSACSPAAPRASDNVSKAADNFEVVRQLTVVNGFTDKVQFELVGAFSITDEGNQLEVVAKLEDGSFRKHFVGLSDNVNYIVEDLDETKNADAWVYEVFYLPESIVNVEVAR